MTQEIGFEVQLVKTYEQALASVEEALKQEGFGVLTKIDVRSTLKKKLNEDFRPYAILGACNPSLAHQALLTEPSVGLMLPCNVTVEASDEHNSLVRILNPQIMMGVGDFKENEAIVAVADEAYQRLSRVAAALNP
jgi:uncharacterized protein (DUF302 family)